MVDQDAVLFSCLHSVWRDRTRGKLIVVAVFDVAGGGRRAGRRQEQRRCVQRLIGGLFGLLLFGQAQQFAVGRGEAGQLVELLFERVHIVVIRQRSGADRTGCCWVGGAGRLSVYPFD